MLRAHAACPHEFHHSKSWALIRRHGAFDCCSLAWTLLYILGISTAQLSTHVLRVEPRA